MFFYGRIIIPLHSLSSKSRNSKVFTHSDFEMVLSFAIIGSIAATALKFKRHFKIRMCEHLGVSALTGKRVKGNNDSAIKERHLFCNYSSGFDDFCILASNNNDFKVTLMESLLINRDHPPWNKNRHSLPLELFDD